MQGLECIGGMLLRVGMTEAAAFRLFFTMMENFGYSDLYAKNFQGLKVKYVTFDMMLLLSPYQGLPSTLLVLLNCISVSVHTYLAEPMNLLS